MAFGSSVLTHKKEQQIKIEGEFKPTVDCLCATRRGFVFIHKGMDNSSLAFMHELSQRSYPSDGILSVYDLILIPKWVMEEIEDSTWRSTEKD